MHYEDGMRFSLRAQPENVAVVRRAVAVRAEELGMEQPRIVDLSTAVSEACSNVVLHAYEDRKEPGLLEVELVPGDRELSVVIRDFGRGLSTRLNPGKLGLGMGLQIIGALASRLQIVSVPGEGTEIVIHALYAATVGRSSNGDG